MLSEYTFCGYCGKKNPSFFNFCTGCGKPVERLEEDAEGDVEEGQLDEHVVEGVVEDVEEQQLDQQVVENAVDDVEEEPPEEQIVESVVDDSQKERLNSEAEDNKKKKKSDTIDWDYLHTFLATITFLIFIAASFIFFELNKAPPEKFLLDLTAHLAGIPPFWLILLFLTRHFRKRLTWGKYFFSGFLLMVSCWGSSWLKALPPGSWGKPFHWASPDEAILVTIMFSPIFFTVGYIGRFFIKFRGLDIILIMGITFIFSTFFLPDSTNRFVFLFFLTLVILMAFLEKTVNSLLVAIPLTILIMVSNHWNWWWSPVVLWFVNVALKIIMTIAYVNFDPIGKRLRE